jgi:hypothetical protein
MVGNTWWMSVLMVDLVIHFIEGRVKSQLFALL